MVLLVDVAEVVGEEARLAVVDAEDRRGVEDLADVVDGEGASVVAVVASAVVALAVVVVSAEVADADSQEEEVVGVDVAGEGSEAHKCHSWL